MKRKCCICGSNDTYIRPDGIHIWLSCKCGKENCTRWLCSSCHQRYDPDSNHSLIKSMRHSRNGSLDRFSNDGKAVIGQWVAAKTLGLRDLNIDNDNLRSPIDLSEHPLHGILDVKICTFNSTYGCWETGKMNHNFDNLLVLCMDKYELWRYVERAYIIPEYTICGVHITIVKNPSRRVWYEDFIVYEKFYNDTYNSVDIPRVFSPFDLWKGRYNKKV